MRNVVRTLSKASTGRSGAGSPMRRLLTKAALGQKEKGREKQDKDTAQALSRTATPSTRTSTPAVPLHISRPNSRPSSRMMHENVGAVRSPGWDGKVFTLEDQDEAPADKPFSFSTIPPELRAPRYPLPSSPRRRVSATLRKSQPPVGRTGASEPGRNTNESLGGGVLKTALAEALSLSQPRRDPQTRANSRPHSFRGSCNNTSPRGTFEQKIAPELNSCHARGLPSTPRTDLPTKALQNNNMPLGTPLSPQGAGRPAGPPKSFDETEQASISMMRSGSSAQWLEELAGLTGRLSPVDRSH